MSVNQNVIDRGIGHDIDLQRTYSRIARDVVRALNRGDRALLQALREGLVSGVPMALLLTELAELHAARFTLAAPMIERAAIELARFEPDFQRNILRRSGFEGIIRSPDLEDLALIGTTGEIAGNPLAEWVNRTRRTGFARIRKAVLSDESARNIIRRVQGTRPARGRDGLLQRERDGIETLTKTFLHDATERSRQRLFEDNTEVYRQVVIVAVLDNRTSSICQRLHLQRYPVDQGPRPPFHMNCRSRAVGILKAGGAINVPTFTEWIRRQDVETQEELLGPTRAQWLRDHPRQTVRRAWLLDLTGQPGLTARELRYRRILATEGVAA